MLFWIGGGCARTERFRFLAGTAWDVASPQLIQRVKSNDCSLEKLVQRELRAKGLRFRCHVGTLSGRSDSVFPRERVAVFVDGDFWHGWRLPAWEGKLSEFWRDKLHANRARDQRNFRRLRALGWRIIRLWQHDVHRDLAACVQRVSDTLETP